MKKILINETIFDKTLPYQDWFIEENMTNDVHVVEIDDEYYIDCVIDDFDLIDNAYIFNVEKYNARKQKENKLNYKKEVERLVALRYDIYDELAIQRQKEEKPEEYKEYYNYVEQCKLQAKELCNIDKEVKDVYTE